MSSFIPYNDLKLTRKHFELIEKCPLSYKYRFIETAEYDCKNVQIKSDLKEGDNSSARDSVQDCENIYLKLFALIEPGIIDFHKQIIYLNIYLKQDADIKMLFNSLEKTRANIKNMNIDDETFSKALKMADMYYTRFLPENLTGISVKEFLVLRYNNYYFYNIINRIDISDTDVILYFFKVGSVPGNKSFLINDLRNQSAVLAAMQNPAYKNKKIKLKLLYLDSGETIEIVPEQKEIIEFERRIKENLYNISVMEYSVNHNKQVIKLSDNYIFRGRRIYIEQCNNDLELARPSGGCAYCSYYSKCVYWTKKPFDKCGESFSEYSKRLKLSYSKYSGFKHCQYSWKLRYIDRVPSKPQPFFDLGHSVHETLEKFYDKYDKTLRNNDYLMKIYSVIFDKFREGYSSDEEKIRYFENGKKMLEKYYESFVKDKEFKPAYITEAYFEIPIGKNVNMNGYIDRIDDLGNGMFEILDYKTEPTDRTQEDIDEDDQLSIYFWAAENMFGVKIENVSLFMMEFDKKISTFSVIKRIENLLEDIDKTSEIIIEKTRLYEEKINKLKNNNAGDNDFDKLKKSISLEIFPPSINKYCRSCDFLNDCILKEKILSDETIISMEK
ncbi:PD-(D/E)XK nuclease family protein [Candidatus Dependentiae bacterium]|nr:PD-(D/E)XK nuclease family protein [Candidatus Dependentiae bacterium]